MIIGECPYDDCNGPLMVPLADRDLPLIERHECEHCNRVIWTKHSRLDPCSWTDDGFREDFEVDSEGKVVREKQRHAPTS